MKSKSNLIDHDFLAPIHVLNAADPLFHTINTRPQNFNDVKSIFQSGNYGYSYEDAISLLLNLGFIVEAKNKAGQDIYKVPSDVSLKLKSTGFIRYYLAQREKRIKQEFIDLLTKNKGRAKYDQYMQYFKALNLTDQEILDYKEKFINGGILQDDDTPGSLQDICFASEYKEPRSKVKVFLSFSEVDRNRMKRLRTKISESELLQPIVIEDKRKGLAQLADLVKEGISEADFFIPILTSESIKTQWINQEIGFAISRGNEIEIIPMVQRSIISDLKGFIHKQQQLSYGFELFDDDKKSRKSFRDCYKEVLEYIESKILVNVKRVNT